jgi:hypothetical protein
MSRQRVTQSIHGIQGYQSVSITAKERNSVSFRRRSRAAEGSSHELGHHFAYAFTLLLGNRFRGNQHIVVKGKRGSHSGTFGMHQTSSITSYAAGSLNRKSSSGLR